MLAVALVALVTGTATYELEAHGDGLPENLHQLKRLQVYDLAGATQADPKLDLSILHREAPDLEQFIRKEAAPNFRPAGSDNLENLPGADTLLIPEGDAVRHQWRALITQQPGLYLHTRMRVFLSTLLTPKTDSCPMYFVGIDGEDPGLLRDAGLTERYNDKDQWDDSYSGQFLGTPVFSHLFYGGLLLILLLLALRDSIMGHREPEVLVVIAMSVAALLFTASFFVISGDCDYRYLYFLDVAAMVALVQRVSARR